MLNEHDYCCELGPGICQGTTGAPAPGLADKCKSWHVNKMNKRTENAKALGIPLVLTEFGACTQTTECVTEVTQVADASDSVLSSGWAYWQFKYFNDITTTAGTGSEGFYNPDGTLQIRKVKALSRTYVKHAQGTIKAMKFAAQDS